VQEHNAELTKLMHESFTGNRVIKAYNLEATVIEQFRATTRKYVSQMMRVIRSNEIPSQLMEFFGAAGIALVFIYVQQLPKDQQPKASDFFTFILSIVMIYPPIKSFTRLHNQLHQARAASERVFVLLATKNSMPEPAQPKMLHASHADIEFQNLDFNYGEKPVLRSINLTVKAGQLVALVGASGSGKTTLANLLLRFYDPARGMIKIGGVDLRDVSTRDLRNQIAVVAQENILFKMCIRDSVVGFHTRNVAHRAHEHIQIEALRLTDADGLLISPVIGPRKRGDFQSSAVLASYQACLENGIYPKNHAVLSGFASYPRYAGPREAVFTAICRQNMGCSHFIVGRDHTGIRDYYKPDDSQRLFENIGDIGIVPVFFGAIGYDAARDSYGEDLNGHLTPISGTEVRDAVREGRPIPNWMVRQCVQDALRSERKAGRNVFVE